MMNKMVLKLRGITKKIIALSPYIVLSLVVVYFLSDFLSSPQTYHMDDNRTVSKILLILVTFVSFFFSILFFIKQKKYYDKSFLLIFFSWLILSIMPIISDFVNGVLSYNSIVLAIYPFSFLSLFSFWLLLREELVNKTILKYWLLFAFFFIFFFLAFYFFKVRSTPLPSLNYRKPILSHVYLIIGLLPLAYYLFEEKQFIIFLISSIVLVILSDKGTPLISLFIIIGYFFYKWLSVKNLKVSYAFIIGIVTLPVILLIVDLLFLNNLIINKFFDKSILIRLSGYSEIFDAMKEFSILEIFFGKGSSSVIALRGLAAHNDFLEYFFDYGLLGLFFFMLFLTSLFIFLKQGRNTSFAIIIISILLPITLFSAIFTNTNMFLFLSLGICIRRISFSKSNIVTRSFYDQIFI